MPTIKDIAREAGVSHGTVSNVINGRGNVSVEKIHRVWQAVEKLGYVVNSKAKSLRKGGRARSVAVFLPSIEEERYAAMYEVFQSEFTLQGYAVQLYVSRSMETTEKTLLADALTAQHSAMIISSSLPDAVSYYRSETPTLPLVFLQRDGPAFEDVMYASFDPEKAGREIAHYTKHHCAKHIGVFIGNAVSPDEVLFLRGLQSVYGSNNPSVCYLSCPDHQIELRAFEFFSSNKDYNYIICTDRRRERATRAACSYANRHPMPSILTLATKRAVANPDEKIYELDYKQLAYKISASLLSCLEKDVSLSQTLYMENCGFRQMESKANKKRHLRMLTMDSPSSTALMRLLPYLEKCTGIQMELRVLPSLREVYDLLQTPDCKNYDLIRMDVVWMDELAERLFLPLEQIDFDWDGLLDRMIPELGGNFTTSRGNRYCLPYDPSTQLMFYRKDLFTSPTYKRMYFEQYRKELIIPESFSEYNQVAAFFTQSVNAGSPTQYGSTIAVGNVSVSPCEFIPRLFEEGGSLLDTQGRITIDSPEGRRALENYRETYTFSDRTVYDFWANALEGFAEGAAAMTIVYINYASHILNLRMSRIAGKLGFAPVPGKKPLLGGGVLGITRDCVKIETACDFLSWLYSDPVAPVFTMLGGLSPCLVSYANRDINEKYPWLSAARASFSSAQRRGNSGYYANFSELQLENILAEYVQSAVLGQLSPAEALRQAQRDCDAYFRPLKQ